MWSLVLIGVLSTTVAEFEVRTLEGEPVRGALLEVTAEHVVVQAADGPHTLASETLVGIAPVAKADPSGETPSLTVRLNDGSELKATRYSVHKAMATIGLAGHLPVDVPQRTIRFVRFRVPDAEESKLEKQWSDIISSKASSDVLVVRKGDSLDFLEGVHRDVDDKKVSFELDKEPLPVNREKVEGLLYYHAEDERPARTICRLFDVDGNILSVESASVGNDEIKVVTPSKLEMSIPLSHIARIDYSQGKIVYLSDLETERVKYTPPFGTNAELPALTAYYAPRRDIGFEQQPLRLDGQTYQKGLALRSRTAVVYRLPDRFGRFQARVGIDPGTSETGYAHLEIKSGGRILWEGDLRGSEPARDLDIKLTDVTRLEFLVDFGDGLDVGDDVNLCDARVTK